MQSQLPNSGGALTPEERLLRVALKVNASNAHNPNFANTRGIYWGRSPRTPTGVPVAFQAPRPMVPHT